MVKVVRGRQPADELHLSFDRKVAVEGRWQESRRRWIPGTPNSFGLPAGGSCPGKTSFCVSCYGRNAENSKGVARLLHHNFTLLTRAGGIGAMADLLGDMLDRYEAHARTARIDARDRIFRIHWDGDFYSTDYARAWAHAMAHRDITFWAYTRSFTGLVDVTPILADIENLRLYLSIDADNAAAAAPVLAERPRLLAAGCADDYRTARKLIGIESFHNHMIRQSPVPCPENAGRMALMADARGACTDCRICPDGRRDILFATSGREDATVTPVAAPGPRSGPDYPCALPECTNMITPTIRRGRPRTYCDRACQLRARNHRNRTTTGAPT